MAAAVTSETNELVILGDIGGTRTRFRLLSINVTNEGPLFQREELTSKYPSILEHLEAFIEQTQKKIPTLPPITNCCLGVCGVVDENGKALLLGGHFGDIGWIVDEIELSSKLKMNIKVINDFVAIGNSLPEIRNFLEIEEDIKTNTTNNSKEANKNIEKRKVEYIHESIYPVSSTGVMVCLGAGTGLGECYSVYIPQQGKRSSSKKQNKKKTLDKKEEEEEEGGKYHVFSSEGGFSEFNPRNTNQRRLKEYLIKKYNSNSNNNYQDQDEFVENEKVISGNGIYNIYQWLVEESKTSVGSTFGFYYDLINQSILLKINQCCSNEENDHHNDNHYNEAVKYIIKYGTGSIIINSDTHDEEYIEPSCPLCAYAIEMFLDCLGAEAANLALRYQATGGVFIAGGSVVYKLLNEPNMIDKIATNNNPNDKADCEISCYENAKTTTIDINQEENNSLNHIKNNSFIINERKERIRKSYLQNTRSLPVFADRCPLFLVNIPGDDLAMIGAQTVLLASLHI